LNLPVFSNFSVTNLSGARGGAANVAGLLASALTGGLTLFLVLFLLRTLLRKQWLAAIVFVGLFTFNQLSNSQSWSSTSALAISIATVVLIYGILVVIMTRLGFFAFMVTLFTVNSLVALFLTLDFGA
jgi:hypothetical protein